MAQESTTRVVERNSIADPPAAARIRWSTPVPPADRWRLSPQKHTSDLERSLVLVSWSAWTNLRCLVGRRPPDRPGTFRGAPFRAHAHDPTGESAPSWFGCPSHAVIHHEFRRTSSTFLPGPAVAGLPGGSRNRSSRTGSRGLAELFPNLAVRVGIHSE